MAKALFLSAPAPGMVIDPQDSSVPASIKGIVTFRDPKRPPADAAHARFVPTDPQDRDAYDVLYRWLFAHFPRYVWLDEAGLAAPAQGSPRWLRTLVVQGRKRELGHVACHTRPREVDRNLIAQAQHVMLFGLYDPDDRVHIARIVGLPVAELEVQLAALEHRGFLWWNQLTRELQPMRPLRVR